jgi:hypothetical protein
MFQIPFNKVNGQRELSSTQIMPLKFAPGFGAVQVFYKSKMKGLRKRLPFVERMMA